MLVRLNTDRRCMIRGHQWAGEVVDLTPAEAHALVHAQQAEYAEPERAAASAPENAARHSKLRRRP